MKGGFSLEVAMKFDPKFFIACCQRAGFTVSRMGAKVHYTTNGQQVDGAALFVGTMRQHKRQLLKHLPERSAPVQTDLFQDDPRL